MPSVGLALIAKNEEENLPTLLASIEGAFDQMVLVDTGSTDKTKDIFNVWAIEEKKRNKRFFFKVRDFKWVDDFGAAREFAHSHLDTDWEVWADCDDIIKGAQNIRSLCEKAPAELCAYVCGYNYAQAGESSLCYLKRERIVRKGGAVWQGRIHEAQVIAGPAQFVDPQVVEWVHNKPAEQNQAQFNEERNLRILRKWIQDEPENTRVLAYLGTEEAARGRHKKAVAYYKRYLKLNPEWVEEHAQVHRKLATSLFALERYKEGRDLAYRAMNVDPTWPDSYIVLAEYWGYMGHWDKTIYWADRVLEMGVPDTVLIINPMDYTWHPLKLKTIAYNNLGKFDEALAVGRKAATMLLDPPLADELNRAQSQEKREQTAQTYVMAAKALVAHDEQLKAVTLLEECVPYYVQDHPLVVAARSELRQRLLWLNSDYTEYYNVGAKMESSVPDDKIAAICESLPRVEFLLFGLQEQLNENGTVPHS